MLARLVGFVAGTTRITAADFLNPIQDEVIALYAGTKSIASLLIDGTGDNASAVAAGFASILKGIIIPGGADANVVLDVTTAPTKWRVILRLKLGSIYVRFGITPAGMLVTYNADYDIANSRWQRDSNTARAAAIYLYATACDVLWYDATSSATWGSWSIGFRSSTTGAATVGNGLTVSAGGVSVTGGVSTDTALTVSTGDVTVSAGGISTLDSTNGNVAAAGYLSASKTIGSATTGAGQALALGRAYKDTLPVASCYVTNSGTAALQWGFNIASVPNRTAAGIVEVTLTNYPSKVVIDKSLRGTGVKGFITAAFNSGNGQITVETYDAAGTATDFAFDLTVRGGS